MLKSDDAWHQVLMTVTSVETEIWFVDEVI